jgi:hypothetical protein
MLHLHKALKQYGSAHSQSPKTGAPQHTRMCCHIQARHSSVCTLAQAHVGTIRCIYSMCLLDTGAPALEFSRAFGLPLYRMFVTSVHVHHSSRGHWITRGIHLTGRCGGCVLCCSGQPTGQKCYLRGACLNFCSWDARMITAFSLSGCLLGFLSFCECKVLLSWNW